MYIFLLHVDVLRRPSELCLCVLSWVLQAALMYFIVFRDLVNRPSTPLGLEIAPQLSCTCCPGVQLSLDRHAGTALSVDSLNMSQMNKVLLFIIRGCLL